MARENEESPEKKMGSRGQKRPPRGADDPAHGPQTVDERLIPRGVIREGPAEAQFAQNPDRQRPEKNRRELAPLDRAEGSREDDAGQGPYRRRQPRGQQGASEARTTGSSGDLAGPLGQGRRPATSRW